MASIKEKIQKLLALASSPNENEAKAALLKAKELMAKNKFINMTFKPNTTGKIVDFIRMVHAA